MKEWTRISTVHKLNYTHKESSKSEIYSCFFFILFHALAKLNKDIKNTPKSNTKEYIGLQEVRFLQILHVNCYKPGLNPLKYLIQYFQTRPMEYFCSL